MIELLRNRDLTVVHFYREVLAESGIPTFIRNEPLVSIMAPIPDFFPALCILNADDQDRAMDLIRENMEENANAADLGVDWECPACHESNPGNFDLCWSCDSPRPSDIS